MSSRDEILASIRANLPRVERPLPEVPLFDGGSAAPLLSAFKDGLERVGGVFLDPPASSDSLSPVRAKIAGHRLFDGSRNRRQPRYRQRRDAARASERGLCDRPRFVRRRRDRLRPARRHGPGHQCARLSRAQHLIVLLDPGDIVINLHYAYRRPEFRDKRYAAFHSGPSATADIEGVLIHGAQGVRSHYVLPLARARLNS